jgi:hypothetical protein
MGAHIPSLLLSLCSSSLHLHCPPDAPPPADNFPPIVRLFTNTPLFPVPTNTILPFIITFSENIVLADYPTTSVPVTVTGPGAASTPLFLSAATVTELQFDVTPVGQGVITVTVPAGAAPDPNSILNDLPSNTVTLLYDSVLPAVQLLVSAPYFARASTLTAGAWELVLVVSEVPRLVTQDMLNVTNARVDAGSLRRRPDLDGRFPPGSNVYSVALTPLAEGPVRATMMPARFKDLANNLNTRNDTELVLDRVPPPLALHMLHPNIDNRTVARFQVGLGEELPDMGLAAITVLNGDAVGLFTVNVTAGPWPGQVRLPVVCAPPTRSPCVGVRACTWEAHGALSALPRGEALGAAFDGVTCACC